MISKEILECIMNDKDNQNEGIGIIAIIIIVILAAIGLYFFSLLIALLRP